MKVIDILLALFDQPALQQPIADAIAKYVKTQIPPGAEKDIKDLLTLIAAAL